MTTSFADLGVPDYVCEALHARGIIEPFEIQAVTIKDTMAGRDVCGRAPTGSGKTLAFGIPLVAGVETAKPRHPKALVLAPTRELADQIYTELKSFSGKKRVGVVYGGVGYGPQVNALRQGVDILVACPGRLEDLIERGDVVLSQVDKVVLDEADRMADMGFMPAVRRLLDQARRDRQTVLFSATLDGDVAKLTRDYQRDPVRHEIGEETPDITVAEHVFWQLNREDKTQHTLDAINAVWPAIVFTRTRHGADRLTKRLDKLGVKAVAIHGGRSQNQRTRALADFAEGRVHALIATDVAARGIHVDGVALVVHYDPPEDHKTYVHRSGRTARAGESGVVLSFVERQDRKDYGKIQRQVELDEPFIDPDPLQLRELSDAPTRTLAPSRPEDRQSQGGGNRQGNRNQGNRNHRSRSGGGRSQGGRGGRSGQGRNRNSERSDRGDDERSERRDDWRGGESDGRARSGGGRSRSGGGGRSNNRPKSKGGRPGGPKGKSQGGKSGGPKRSSNGSRRNDSSSNQGGPNRKQRRAHLQTNR